MADSGSPQGIPTAKAPTFHGRYRPSSRIILRSSDGQRFAVSRSSSPKTGTPPFVTDPWPSVLTIHLSNFFADLFELPRPTKSTPPIAGGTWFADETESDGLTASPLAEGSSGISSVGDQPRVVDTSGSIKPSEPAANSNPQATCEALQAEANSRSRALEKQGPSEEENKKVAAEKENDDQEGDDVAVKINSDQTRAPQKEDFDVDVDWNTLAMFLDLLQIAQFPKLVDSPTIKLDLQQVRKVLPMAKKYDCHKLLRVLDIRLQLLAAADPWGVLKLASVHEDLDLARIAIGLMALGPHIHDPRLGAQKTVLWRRLDDLPPSWQLAFLRAVLPFTYTDEGGSYSGAENVDLPVQQNFATVARDFAPSRYEARQD